MFEHSERSARAGVSQVVLIFFLRTPVRACRNNALPSQQVSPSLPTGSYCALSYLVVVFCL
jgi:hypothetical protein